jgi:hypothetical protein
VKAGAEWRRRSAPHGWSILVAVSVVAMVLRRLAASGLQSYGADGAQYIEHTARLRVLKSWQQLGDVAAWRFLFDADAAFPPFLHLVTLPTGVLVGHTAAAATAVSVGWLLLLAGVTGWIAQRLSRSDAVGAAAVVGTLLVPALHGYASRYYYDLPVTAITWLAAAVLLAGRDRWPLRAAAVAAGVFTVAVLTKWAALAFGVPLLLAALVVRPVSGALADGHPSEALLLNLRSRVVVGLLGAAAVTLMLSGYVQMSGAENSLRSMGQTALPGDVLVGPDLRTGPLASLPEPLAVAAARSVRMWSRLRPDHILFYPMRLVTSVFSPALSLLLAPLLLAWLALSRRGFSFVMLLLGVYGSFLLVVMPVWDDRFLVPLVPALVLAGAFGWAELGARWRRRFAAAVLVVGLAVLMDFHFGDESLATSEVRLSRPMRADVPETIARGLGAAGSVEQRGWARGDQQLPSGDLWRAALWQEVREQEPTYLGVPGQSELIDPWGDLEWWRYRGLLDQVSGPRKGPEVIAICPPPGAPPYEPEEPDLVVALVRAGNEPAPPSCLSPMKWRLVAVVGDPQSTKAASFWTRRGGLARAATQAPSAPGSAPQSPAELELEPPPGDLLPADPSQP